MKIVHDSRDPFYRSPGGASPCGAAVTLRLRIEGGAPDAVYLRQWFDRESFTPMIRSGEDDTLWESTVVMPAKPCLYWYDFQVWSHGQFHWYGNAEDRLGGVGAPIWGEARSYQITVYDPALTSPEWTDGAVFYQIFPDRFARGASPAKPPDIKGRVYHESWEDTPLVMTDPETGDNVAHDFFGGTLNGIREKLPYLASLGITGLYLNPIFAAHTNHRFDTTDWMRIDPLLGTEEDFNALCEAAAEQGMHLILDGVFSHSGDHNPFFQSAQQSKDSPYRNWYRFEHWPDMYKSWWGFTTLPELDKHQPDVVRYFLTDENAVVKKWLREGASGWRLDVADELPMPYLRLLRQSVKQTREDALIIGEVWEDASNKMSYGQLRCYCLGDTLDSVMNYPLREAAIEFLLGILDASGFKRRMDSLYENYPAPFARSLLNVLGSHDRARVLNVLAGRDGAELPRAERGSLRLTPAERQLGLRRLKLLLELIIAMPGMPCVYYGDEAGMEGSWDPFCRGTFPWGREDTDLTEYFATALARRKQIAALTDGSLHIDAPAQDVLCVRREGIDGQRAYTVINRSDWPQEVEVEGRWVHLEPYGCILWENDTEKER